MARLRQAITVGKLADFAAAFRDEQALGDIEPL
jgi:hypothetical protein